MALQRSEKEAVVADVAERLKKAEVVVLTDFRGLDVTQISKLRRDLRDAGAEFKVVKNTLTLRAFESAGIDPPQDMLEGPTAVALLYENLSAPAKALLDHVKDTGILSIKGGVMGGRLIDADTVKALSELPSREELLAQFAGLLKTPMRQYVTVLSAPLRDFVGVLNARAESGSEG